MRTASILIICLLLSFYNSAQVSTIFQTPVSINADGSDPHGKAILDLKSDDKGILIPRMNYITRNSIPSPPTGLLIYQTDHISGFYFYNGAKWVDLGTSSTMHDEDGDTKIQLEASPDDDLIHFDLGGKEYFIMDGPRLIVKNSGESVFIGEDAGANDIGGSNVGIGYRALFLNTSGSSNTASGYGALFNNLDGERNTATGFGALFQNDSGNVNTALGANALYSNFIGYGNTASGVNALLNNIRGDNNTADGTGALISNNDGNNNTASGADALSGIFSGSHNTGIGYRAGYDYDGDQNTFIGAHADATIPDLNNATAIGYNAKVSSNNSLVLGKDANVGIGTSTPENQLDVESSAAGSSGIIRAEYTGVYAIDQSAVYGEVSMFDYYGFGVYGKGGYIGVQGQVTATGSNIYKGVDGSAIGGTGVNYGIYGYSANGSTNYAGYFDGNVTVTGTFNNPSDIKLKKDVQEVDELMLNKIHQLRVKQFRYINTFETMRLPQGERIGLIAQDVKNVFPELVSVNIHPDESTDINGQKICNKIEYLGINYIELIPILTKCIQELSTKIEQLENQEKDYQLLTSEIKDLKAKNEILQTKISEIDNLKILIIQALAQHES